MSLDASALQSAILSFLGSKRVSAAVAAADFAALYDTYAQGAQFGASAPTLTGCKALFETAMLGALPGTPASLSAAVAAYWGSGTVPVVGPAVGVVNGCPGAAGIAGALASMFLTANTAAVAAATVAAAVHAATLTCTATLTPPPGGAVVPIA
jgi:hypothetical protein